MTRTVGRLNENDAPDLTDVDENEMHNEDVMK